MDDVVAAFLAEIEGGRYCEQMRAAEIPSYRIQLGDLAGRIQAFHEMRNTLTLPDFADWFQPCALCNLSFLCAVRGAPERSLEIKSDARGSLAEFIKQKHCRTDLRLQNQARSDARKPLSPHQD